MIKAVLFDLDGTLVNSLADLADSTNFALNELGFPPYETEEYKYFVGDGIPKLIERALPDGEKTEQNKTKCLELFMARYREHYFDKNFEMTCSVYLRRLGVSPGNALESRVKHEEVKPRVFTLHYANAY